MEKRFRALRFIGTLYKVLAWITLVGAILISLFLVITGATSGGNAAGSLVPNLDLGGAVGGIVAGIATMIMGLIYFLILYAVAEAIYVILSIEENTRLTAMALSGRASA